MTDLFKEIIDETKKTPGFIAISITEIESGVSYASHTVSDNFDPVLSATYNLQVVKAKLRAIEALSNSSQEILDLVITLTDETHIIKVAPSKRYYIYLVVNSAESNIGIIKSVLNKYTVNLFNTF